MSRVFRPRPLTALERVIALEAALGFTAQQTANHQGMTLFQVYEAQRALKTLLGANTLPQMVALAIAYGDVGFDEVLKGRH